MTQDVRTHVLSGAAWNYLASAIALIAQLAYVAATARLIAPTGFGAYAAAQSLFAIASYFTLSSLGNAVLRAPTRTPAVVGSAFMLATGAGAITAAAAFLAAPVWASLWNAPAAEPLARALAVAIALSAAASVPLALLRGALRYRRAALVEVTAQVSGMVFGAGAAAATARPMALVFGQIVGATVLLLLAAHSARRDLSFRVGLAEALQLISFAGQVSAQNFIYFAIYTGPALLISRAFGPTTLGFFSRANVMVTLPLTHVGAGVTKALYPLYSRLRGDEWRIRSMVEDALIGSTALTWPCFAAAAGAAPVVVDILLGAGWAPTAELLRPLALFGAFNLAFIVAGNPLEALGRLRLSWLIQAAWVVTLTTALASALALDASASAVLTAVAAAQVAVHVLQLCVADRVGYLRIRRVLRGYAGSAGVAAGFFVVPILAQRALAGENAFVVLAADIAACALAAAALAMFGRSVPVTRAASAATAIALDQRRSRRVEGPQWEA